MRLNELNFRDLTNELPLLSFTQRLLLVAGLWVVLFVACFLLFWKASLDESARLDVSVQESLLRLKAQSQLLLDKPAIETELAQLEALLPLMKMALPSERELALLLARINDLILKHELELAEFTPKESTNLEVMRVVPVKLSVRGDGGEIARLPNYIAALSRQVSLKEFEMLYLAESKDWQLSGELSAFAQLPLQTPATTEQADPSAESAVLQESNKP